MQIGVGLPATIPATEGGLVVEWAKRADAGPFSYLGVLDRVLYDNYESMIALAAAAAVTRRIELATTIIIAPLRNATILAKQAASIDAISGGRLTLGVGLGARQDDYDVTGSDYRTRGRRLADQLATMREIWEDEEIGPKPCRPGGPKLLVGGGSGLAMSRMARFSDGYAHNGGPPRAFARVANEARAAWTDAGRPGMPELWGMAYFDLNPDGPTGADYLRHYYAFTGSFAEKIAAGLLTSAEEIAEFVHGYEDAGCDQLIVYPTVPDITQLDLLADVIALR